MKATRCMAALAALGFILFAEASLARAQNNSSKTPNAEASPNEPLLAPPGPAPTANDVGPVKQLPPVITPAPAGEHDGTPGQEPDNPTGRQEPAVSLEWIGPPQAKVGKPADYAIAVRNVCNTSVQQVTVRVRFPAALVISATEPKALSEGNVLMWELGTLSAKQEKTLQLRIVPDGKGLLGCQAWVTFTGSSAMRLKVTEPKLTLKAAGPAKVLVGDAATFVLTVTNPGDGPAEQVKIHAVLGDGLEHPRGKTVELDVGNLAAGESRSVQVICGTKAGGEQKCECFAEGEGDLKAHELCSVIVIVPRLDLEVNGPKFRYLDRKATYSFKVTNPGDAPASNVLLSDVIPPGFKFSTASDGGRHDFSTRTVSWLLGEVAPGQSREVKMEVIAINPGEHRHQVTALAARGLKVDGEIVTRVEGLSAILVELVDTEDPIEVGAETTYEIRITNTGSKSETDIRLVCMIPDKMQFKSAQGPSRHQDEGKEIVFDPLPKLAPRADAIYRVTVKALAPGDCRFKAQITSTNLVEPVIEMESTRVYQD